MKKYLIYTLTPEFYTLVKHTIGEMVHEVKYDYKLNQIESLMFDLRCSWLSSKHFANLPEKVREAFRPLMIPRHTETVVELVNDSPATVRVGDQEVLLHELPIYKYYEWTDDLKEERGM